MGQAHQTESRLLDLSYTLHQPLQELGNLMLAGNIAYTRL
jgi:hypothetical protein